MRSKRITTWVSTFFSRFWNSLLNGIGAAGVIVVYFMVFLVFFEVVTREWFNFGAIYAVEFTIYCSAFVCFIGACHTQSVNQHITITLITSRLPQKVQQWLRVITTAAALLISGIFAYWTAVMVKMEFEAGTHAVTPLQPPLGAVHSIMVLGFFLMFLVLLIQLFKSVMVVIKTEKNKAGADEKKDFF